MKYNIRYEINIRNNINIMTEYERYNSNVEHKGNCIFHRK